MECCCEPKNKTDVEKAFDEIKSFLLKEQEKNYTYMRETNVSPNTYIRCQGKSDELEWIYNVVCEIEPRYKKREEK